MANITAEATSQIEMLAGCAPYIAPEQADERRAPSTDIYALGVVAYVCLTAQPFPGNNPNQVLPKPRQDPPPLPSDIPRAVRHVIMRALDRDPRSRWASAEAMGAAAATSALEHSD